MGRRDVAFILAALGGGLQFFGAMVGQGMLGSGLLFGLGGSGTGYLATMIGLAAAGVTLVLAVRLMFVEDTRSTGRLLLVTVAVGTLAAGPIYLATALPTIAGAAIALRGRPASTAA
jgi:hypothetical protein